MLAAGMHVAWGRDGGGQDASAEDTVDDDVFQKWMELSGMPIGKELQEWWRNLPMRAEGELEAWKVSDSDTALNFLERLLRDLHEREWLEKGATLDVTALARWCRAVVSPEFGGEQLASLDDLVEFLRLELCVVERQLVHQDPGERRCDGGRGAEA